MGAYIKSLFTKNTAYDSFCGVCLVTDTSTKHGHGMVGKPVVGRCMDGITRLKLVSCARKKNSPPRDVTETDRVLARQPGFLWIICTRESWFLVIQLLCRSLSTSTAIVIMIPGIVRLEQLRRIDRANMSIHMSVHRARILDPEYILASRHVNIDKG